MSYKLLIAETGEIRDVKPAKGKKLTLKEMYDLIGCTTVEHLQLAKGVHLWLDEEGRLVDTPVLNRIATLYVQKAFPPGKYLYPGGVMDIVGNAIIEDNTKNGWI